MDLGFFAIILLLIITPALLCGVFTSSRIGFLGGMSIGSIICIEQELIGQWWITLVIIGIVFTVFVNLKNEGGSL